MTVQSLVESQLTSFHHTASSSNLCFKLLKISVGAFFICIIPYLHVGVFGHFVWPTKPIVDPTTCTCSCFDTIFRGIYEHQPGSYKHWYFNSTLNAYKMWCLIIVGAIVAYECFKYITDCVIQHNVRWSMFLLFISSIYPHYYSWWNYLNYYNEQFYSQWYHQIYFTISEIVSTGFVLQLMDKSVKIETYQILAVLSINLSHIIIGGLDQFIANILYKEGNKSQVVRDFGLVIPDFLAVILVLYETRQLLRTRRCGLTSLFYKEELLFCLLVTSFMVMVGKNL